MLFGLCCHSNLKSMQLNGNTKSLWAFKVLQNLKIIPFEFENLDLVRNQLIWDWKVFFCICLSLNASYTQPPTFICLRKNQVFIVAINLENVLPNMHWQTILNRAYFYDSTLFCSIYLYECKLLVIPEKHRLGYCPFTLFYRDKWGLIEVIYLQKLVFSKMCTWANWEIWERSYAELVAKMK